MARRASYRRGGSKRIKEMLAADPTMTARQVADAAGCTIGLVLQVSRNEGLTFQRIKGAKPSHQRLRALLAERPDCTRDEAAKALGIQPLYAGEVARQIGAKLRSGAKIGPPYRAPRVLMRPCDQQWVLRDGPLYKRLPLFGPDARNAAMRALELHCGKQRIEE